MTPQEAAAGSKALIEAAQAKWRVAILAYLDEHETALTHELLECTGVQGWRVKNSVSGFLRSMPELERMGKAKGPTGHENHVYRRRPA